MPRVRERRLACIVDIAPEVVGMPVGEDDGVDVLGLDPHGLQVALEVPGSRGEIPRPRIDQHPVRAGVDQQADVRAHPLRPSPRLQTVFGERLFQWLFRRVGKEEHRGLVVRKGTVIDSRAFEGPDVEAMDIGLHASFPLRAC
jgi:hypothetical protein